MAINNLYKNAERANDYRKADYLFTESVSNTLEELDKVFASRQFHDITLGLGKQTQRDLATLKALAVS